MKNHYALSSIFLVLAVAVVATTAWAEQSGDTGDSGGGIGCMKQQTEQASTGCGGHAPAETPDVAEALTPCGRSEIAVDETRQTATRSAMMDGRAGGWPRRHDSRQLGAKRPAGAEEAGALKHGGCS